MTPGREPEDRVLCVGCGISHLESDVDSKLRCAECREPCVTIMLTIEEARSLLHASYFDGHLGLSIREKIIAAMKR